MTLTPLTRSTWITRGRMCLLLSASLLGLAACGGGDKKDKAASQVAAKVNKEELSVHQINFLLQQQQGLKSDRVDVVSRQLLERLIDQELALQKAGELKVDRDPAVLQRLEAARREIIARAYTEKVGSGAQKPTPNEVSQYYNDKPALFKARRVYNLQELAIEAKPEQIEGLRAKLDAAKSFQEFAEYLKTNGFQARGQQAARAAEQLPLASLETFAKMKDGDSLFNATPEGARVVYLASSRSQPVSEEQARPAITQFLLNERKRKLIEDDIKSLRSTAKIEYVGAFVKTAAEATAERAAEAAKAASAATLPESVAMPAPALPASGALDAGSISGGMGLKGDGKGTLDAMPSSPVAAPASGPLDAGDINKGMGLK